MHHTKIYCLIVKGINVGMSFFRIDCEQWLSQSMSARDARIEERIYRSTQS